MNRHFFSYSFTILLCFPLLLFFREATSATITMLNKCDYTVWPGIVSNAGSSGLGTTGFELSSGNSRSFEPIPGWSGRVWARTRCSFDPSSGQGSCSTGDCGSGQIECNGAAAIPPATLAEFTLGSGSGAQDFYDVSLVDGYNIPMIVEPNGGSGSCMMTGCGSDLIKDCPHELRVGNGDACRSACQAFGNPEYCCSGAYASPATCAPSMYSQMFKASCPSAYSYAFDDATSTFTCAEADYTITFCPTSTSQRKSSRDSGPATIMGQGVGFGFGIGSESGSGTGSGSESGSESGSSSKHSPKFFIGGGQMLPNFSPSNSIINNSKFAWILIIIVIASTTLQFLCL